MIRHIFKVKFAHKSCRQIRRPSPSFERIFVGSKLFDGWTDGRGGGGTIAN